MDDSRTNTKIPFRKSDSYLIFFLIIALLLINAILNLLFGQTYQKCAQFNINNASIYVWNKEEIIESEPEIEFDMSTLGNGISYYMLSFNTRIIDEKKMVLLK